MSPSYPALLSSLLPSLLTLVSPFRLRLTLSLSPFLSPAGSSRACACRVRLLLLPPLPPRCETVRSFGLQEGEREGGEEGGGRGGGGGLVVVGSEVGRRKAGGRVGRGVLHPSPGEQQQQSLFLLFHFSLPECEHHHPSRRQQEQQQQQQPSTFSFSTHSSPSAMGWPRTKQRPHRDG